MALSQRSFFELVEISSLMFLVLFKDETQGESGGGRDAVIIRRACYNPAKLR